MKRMKAEPAGAGGTSKHAEVQPPEVTEHKSDLLIRDLWQQGIGSVHEIHVMNTDALTHRTKYPEKCHHKAERGGICIWRLASSSVGTSFLLSLRRTG